MHDESKQINCTEDDMADANLGKLNSPAYPGEYPNNINLTKIISFGNKRASVNFTILDLEAETNSADCFDYLKVIIA